MLEDHYKNRIEELKEEAVFEGINYNEESEKDFWLFLDFLKPKVGYLFLTDEGNLRLVWKDDINHIGLQFIGNHIIQYVIWKDKRPLDVCQRPPVCGRDRFKVVYKLIKDMGLEFFIYT